MAYNTNIDNIVAGEEGAQAVANRPHNKLLENTNFLKAITDSWLDQSVKTTVSPTFNGLILTGNVGIGRESGGADLEIYNATGTRTFEIIRADGATLKCSAESGQATMGTTSNHPLQIRTNNANKVTIQTNGDMDPAITETQDLGSSGLEWDNIFLQNAATVSDKRVKENIVNSDLGLAFIKSIRPVRFKRKNNKKANVVHTRPHYGFIAQEIKQTMVDSGIDDFAGYAYYKKEDRHVLRLGEFIAPMVKAIQELSEEIQAIKR